MTRLNFEILEYFRSITNIIINQFSLEEYLEETKVCLRHGQSRQKAIFLDF